MDLTKKTKTRQRSESEPQVSLRGHFTPFRGVLTYMTLKSPTTNRISTIFESSRCEVTLEIYNTNTTTVTSGSMCETVRLALD